MQGEKIEAWFVSAASREYFGVESTAFLFSNKFTKKSTHLNYWLNMFFFINEPMKIAVIFSKFQCLRAMLLLRDTSKHGFSVP